MKPIHLLTILEISLIVALLWLLSFKSEAEPARPAMRQTNQVMLWIDQDTGCHYLTRDGYITPRLTADGHQLCLL